MEFIYVEYNICIENNPAEKDIDTLDNMMNQYNYTQAKVKHTTLCLFIREIPSNTIMGGLKGIILANNLYIQTLCLSTSLRRKNYGTELMKLAEKQAKDNNCLIIHLDTFSFQALPFYEKLGYEIFAEFTLANNIKRFFLKKNI
jgi:GNAT superfamily N-acetyltransferase